MNCIKTILVSALVPVFYQEKYLSESQLHYGRIDAENWFSFLSIC